MNEADLLTAACHGCNDAFAQLYKRNLPYVRAVVRAILRTNDVEDICQDTFLLAFTRLSSFKRQAVFRTWITQIARNQCLMALRRNRQITNGDSQLLQIDDKMAADDMLGQCVFTVVDRSLAGLPAQLDLPRLLRVLKPLQRAILEMAYLEDIPDREIADRLGMTLASVKSVIHHAKRRVREVHKKR